MPADLPLFTVILEVIRRTPPWVWGLLLVLIAAGLAQWRDHRQARLRVIALPLGLGAYSLWGATSLFGVGVTSLGGWLAGMALVLVLSARLPWARGTRFDASTGSYLVKASVWPLVLMLAVFLVRYAVTVTLVFHREYAALPMFVAAACAVYGALSGLFASRTLAILRSSPSVREAVPAAVRVTARA